MRNTLLCLALLSAGCSTLGQLAWKAADQAGRYSARPQAVDDIQAPEGFRVVRVVQGLNYPSSMTWDVDGNLYVLESHTVPVPMLEPKIVRVTKDGRITRVKLGGTPIGDTAVGLTFHDGWLWLSHEEQDATFSISRVQPTGGTLERMVTGLPAQGDHDVNYPLFDRNGDLWFGLGTATNSSVVSSTDPVNQKWLAKHPTTAEIPCRDLVLTGKQFNDDKISGAFQPHGSAGATQITGKVPCTGALYRVRRGTTTPELVAWGFRNPVALALDANGALFIGMHGADMRGTRPIKDDPDAIYRFKENAWYGWPDFSAAFVAHAEPVIDLARSGLSAPDRALLVTATKPHAALGGMTFAPDGRLLISEMGDFKPMTDKDSKDDRAGFQVEAVSVDDGTRTIFLRNRGTGDSQPASTLNLDDGLERPVDVKIGPDGNVYVLDFGPFIVEGAQPKAFPKTGKVFRIEKVP
jgi:glucose/arabinose dehydrogenase